MPLVLTSIQILRAIAVLLVVLLHTYGFEPKAGVGESLIAPWIVFGSSGVDLFFVISGFIMVYTTQRADERRGGSILFLYKRLTRIYPLYWLVSGVLLLAYLRFPQHVHRENLAQINLLESFLLVPQATEPLLIVGWTLIHEVYFYLVFSLLLLTPRRYWPSLVLLWLAAVSGYHLLLPGTTEEPLVNLLAHPLTLEFILGCAAGFLVIRQPTRYGIICAASALLFLCGAWSYHYQVTSGSGLAGWTRALMFGPAYAAIVYGVSSAELRGHRFKSPLLNVIGDASYSIYLIHFLIISCVSRIMATAMPRLEPSAESVWDNYLFVTTSIAGSLVSGVVLFLLVERRLIFWSRSIPTYFRGKLAQSILKPVPAARATPSDLLGQD